MKKGLGFVMIAVLVFSLVAGCSNNNDNNAAVPSGNEADFENQPSGSEETTKSEKQDPVTLRLLFRGERPPAIDEVIAEAEKRMAESLNVKLDITYVTGADYKQKVQIAMAAGEDYDLVFNAPWINMNELIAGGYYAELDDLLKEYGPQILETRPQGMWDANKTNGKIFGIPLGVNHYGAKGWQIRKDLREELGLPPIETYDDFINYLYAVKEKYPDVVPFTPNSLNNEGNLDYMMKNSGDPVRHTGFLSNINYTLYFKENDGKVLNLFETEEPVIMEGLKEIRKLYNDGIINADIMAVKNHTDLLMGGKTAATVKNDFGINTKNQATLEQNLPGAQLEFVHFYDLTKRRVSDFKQGNFILIPASSKNKERAVQFLNWAHIKENYDLLAYGIEGKHWEAVGDDQYKVLDAAAYPWMPYLWIWNPTLDREDAGLPPEIIEARKWQKDGANFIPSAITGFTFDPTPVQNEMAQFNSISVELLNPIQHGAVDFESYWSQYKEKAGPLASKIQEEMQKQIDAFLASK